MTDRRLLKVTTEFRDGLLGDLLPDGRCAMVCWPLAAFLQAAFDLQAEPEELRFPEGGALGFSNHVVLRLPDGRILDPTADQFGLAPVYLGQMPDLYRQHLLPQDPP